MNTQPARTVFAKDLTLGGDAPVRIQTMWKQPIGKNPDKDITTISELKRMGCELLRFAVPEESAAQALIELAKNTDMPLVADIHFDYKLALLCIAGGIAKVRINPGNIGAEWKVKEVFQAAKDSNTAIRIGVNAGSLPADLRNMDDKAMAMVAAAERELSIPNSLGFENLVFSLKSSDIQSTVSANELFRKKYDYPLHLGVTEAGPLIPGIVKTTIAFSKLLEQGIGETIRVSLSDTPGKEIITAREILQSLNIRKTGVTIVSCPRCGRAGFDSHAFLKRVQTYLYSVAKPLTVAVMGCAVNGPEEAKHADIGITGAGNSIIIFVKGKLVRKVSPEQAENIFKEELEKLT
ncbi:MAG: flavodoxin-dependent (E)-4-hydroxy-3-methylbut-2-enyl-diphosphate synthase [Spirochaetia bacterium]